MEACEIDLFISATIWVVMMTGEMVVVMPPTSSSPYSSERFVPSCCVGELMHDEGSEVLANISADSRDTQSKPAIDRSKTDERN